LRENDKILIKGSRGMKMEQIAETFIGRERIK
jgi:UDP-N-acetylmuramyl pentapeptide synthase